MATLLITKKRAKCSKCGACTTLPPAPMYFCGKCGTPVNTLGDVTRWLNRESPTGRSPLSRPTAAV